VGPDADPQGNNNGTCQGKIWMSIFIASLDKTEPHNQFEITKKKEKNVRKI
jgi:hypothetical protein